MKRLILTILLAAMTLSLAACGGQTEPVPSSQTEAAPTKSEAIQTLPPATEPPETEIPSEIPTELSAETTAAPETEPAETHAPADPGGDDAVTLVETEDYLIRVIGIDPNGTLDKYTMRLYVENKDPEHELIFNAKYVAVNGIQQEISGFNCSVEPGQAVNDELWFNQNYGPNPPEITDIEAYLNIYRSGHSLDTSMDTVCHYYPKGKDKADEFLRKRQSTDVRVVDTDLLTVISIGRSQDNFYFYPEFYLRNKSDVPIKIKCSGITVNGVDCGEWNFALFPGKTMFTHIAFYRGGMQEVAATLEDINHIQMELTVYRYDINYGAQEELYRTELDFVPAP